MKEQDTSPILYDPTPANAGPAWAWHAAPEWERQCFGISLFWYVQFEHGIK